VQSRIDDVVAKQSADWYLSAPIWLFSSLTSGTVLATCAHMEAPKDGKLNIYNEGCFRTQMRLS